MATVDQFPLYIDAAAPLLPERQGPRPLTTSPSVEVPHPHQQLTQHAPTALQDILVKRAGLLPGVHVAASCVSVRGARAFHLAPELALGPGAAFQCGHEFAHVHPTDGSLHLTLPPSVYDEVVATGWGEPHRISGTMLLFAPRTAAEVELVWQLIVTSYRQAVGGELEDES